MMQVLRELRLLALLNRPLGDVARTGDTARKNARATSERLRSRTDDPLTHFASQRGGPNTATS